MLLLALSVLITFVEATIPYSDRNSKYQVTDEAWFEVTVSEYKNQNESRIVGNITVALFGGATPITVINFLALTSGYTRGLEKLHYKNTPIHRVVPDFIIQMGDITVGDGTGGKSVFASKFNDEAFTLSHRGPGWVAMANHGPDTNGSQFYILLQKARWLDGKHVVFGKVIRGFNVIKTIGDLDSDKATARPKKRVMITDCGLNKLEKPYTLKDDELDATDDL